MAVYKLGLISDLHDVGGSRHSGYIAMQTSMDDAGCDAYFLLGDIVDTWVAADIRGIWSVSRPNTYWTMGNHDGGIWEEMVCPSDFVGVNDDCQPAMTSCGDFYVDFGPWRVICPNTGINKLSTISYAWLDSLLSASSGKYIIILCHIPWSPNVGDEANILFCTDSSATKSMVNAHITSGANVRACIFGHGHLCGYAYPTFKMDGSIIHFEITSSMTTNNYGILNLHDDGGFYIDGYGAQKSLYSAVSGKTFTLDSITGDTTPSSPAQFPKKSVFDLLASSGISINQGDAILFKDGALSWGGAIGSVHHHKNADGTYNTTMKLPGGTITGTTERLPQGDVFKISSVTAD